MSNFSLGGSFINGAMDLIGIGANSAYNNYQTIEALKEMNETNYKRALENRQYETNLANTAYQRARKDMEAAGINPAMLGNGFSGASIPSASIPTAEAGSVTQTGLTGIVGSIINAATNAHIYKDKKDLEIQARYSFKDRS